MCMGLHVVFSLGVSVQIPLFLEGQIWWPLQGPYSQTESYSNVQSVRISTYLFGGHNSTPNSTSLCIPAHSIHLLLTAPIESYRVWSQVMESQETYGLWSSPRASVLPLWSVHCLLQDRLDSLLRSQIPGSSIRLLNHNPYDPKGSISYVPIWGTQEACLRLIVVQSQATRFPVRLRMVVAELDSKSAHLNRCSQSPPPSYLWSTVI